MKFENKLELIQAIRKDIIGEFEAIIQYSNHINATDEPLAKAVWTQIRNEERVHVGELLTLLTYYEPSEIETLAAGEKEVKEIMASLK